MNVRTATRREAGARYEDFACTHLQRAGLALVARNYSCRYGDGADSIGASKRARLQRAAAMFLAQHPAFADATCRFDVVAIAGDAPGAQLHWLRNAFEAS